MTSYDVSLIHLVGMHLLESEIEMSFAFPFLNLSGEMVFKLGGKQKI